MSPRTRTRSASEAYDILSAALAEINMLNSQVAATLQNMDRIRSMGNLNLTKRDQVALDGLIALGIEIFDTPYVFVTAVGSEEQAFLAAFGRAPESCPVGDSVCQYTVTADRVSILDHIQDNPELSRAAASFKDVDTYLGAPWSFEGHALGSFCVLAGRDREWSDDDVRLVEVCADQVTALFAASKEPLEILV